MDFPPTTVTDDQIRQLETLAARAWPAAERVALGPWWLRASPAPPRRVNSVFPHGEDAAPDDLATAIDAAEAFYRDRARPPRFQVTQAAVPAGLDAALAARGYVVEAPVVVQTLAIADLPPSPAVAGRAVIEPAPTSAWSDLYKNGFGRDVSDILALIEPAAAYAHWVDDAGDLVALGLGVAEDGWCGVFGMLTRPALRGRGIGGAVLAALGDWALAKGAHSLYLQLERDNAAAGGLYTRTGFRTAYGYHYRTLEAAAP